MRISDWSSDVCSSDLGAGLTPADLADILDTAEIRTVKAGEAILTEGDLGNDIYVIRVGSMIVEKKIGGKNVFLSYLPAGSYVGEMALIAGGPRTATVKATVKSRSEEHTSELQSLMRLSYAVFCLKKKKATHTTTISII